MVKHSSKWSLIVFCNTIAPHTGHGTLLPWGCGGGGGGVMSATTRGNRGTRRTGSDSDDESDPLSSSFVSDDEPVSWPDWSGSSARINRSISSVYVKSLFSAGGVSVTPNSLNSWSSSFSSGVSALMASCNLPCTRLAMLTRSVPKWVCCYAGIRSLPRTLTADFKLLGAGLDCTGRRGGATVFTNIGRASDWSPLSGSSNTARLSGSSTTELISGCSASRVQVVKSMCNCVLIKASKLLRASFGKLSSWYAACSWSIVYSGSISAALC